MIKTKNRIFILLVIVITIFTVAFGIKTKNLLSIMWMQRNI